MFGEANGEYPGIISFPFFKSLVIFIRFALQNELFEEARDTPPTLTLSLLTFLLDPFNLLTATCNKFPPSGAAFFFFYLDPFPAK
jgi:hypothetical protein